VPLQEFEKRRRLRQDSAYIRDIQDRYEITGGVGLKISQLYLSIFRKGKNAIAS
jgi:hypothetical protein